MFAVLCVQKFEVDLDGAQTLRVLCYSQQDEVESLLGKGAIEVCIMTKLKNLLNPLCPMSAYMHAVCTEI